MVDIATIAAEPTPNEALPWESEPKRPERNIGPRISAEILVAPETDIEPHDFRTGCHLCVGALHESYVLIQLGWDEATRRDACDRLIAALTEIRDWTPAEAPVPA